MFATMRTCVPRIKADSDPNAWFIPAQRTLFYPAHTYKKSSGCACPNKKMSYLERWSLADGGEFPILSGRLLGVNCPCAPCIFLTPPHPLPSNNHLFYIKTALTNLILLWGTKNSLYPMWDSLSRNLTNFSEFLVQFHIIYGSEKIHNSVSAVFPVTPLCFVTIPPDDTVLEKYLILVLIW
jgi:hypothetical protein